MKILITGGAIYGKLDDVKLITNRFNGGLMAWLADLLSEEFEVTYVTSKGATLPKKAAYVVSLDGIYEYQERVLKLALTMDAVILGGAVANLIPQTPFPGKFPSHNYKPGDVINIPFIIAPRIIDQVKKVAPKTCLIGFKLLSGVAHEELIEAAYGVLKDSGASIVIANDAKDLNQKFIVTKEKEAIPCHMAEVAEFIAKLVRSKYYKTVLTPYREAVDYLLRNNVLFNQLKAQYQDKFEQHDNFGTVAVRIHKDTFITTSRKKDTVGVYIERIDHELRTVYCEGESKATLNAPLLDNIFKANPEVAYIVHYHEIVEDLPLKEYETPATAADSQRKDIGTSFCIKHHGCYLLFDEKGKPL